MSRPKNKNLRRISVVVTAQTAYNLGRIAAECGHKDIGRVIDKLTRAKMLENAVLKELRHYE